MQFRLSVLIPLVSLLLPLTHVLAQADADPKPPTAFIFSEDFQSATAWQPVSGTWSVANSTYGNAGAGSTNLSVAKSYRALHPEDPAETQVTAQDFTVRARMRNQGTTDEQLVGLVYGYQDPQNYYEVVVSAIGTVTARTVMNGVAVNEVPSVTPRIPRNTWFDVVVRWNHGVASVSVDGLHGYQAVQQPEFTTGRIGLVTHGTVGRFDKVQLTYPFGDQHFLEMFDEAPFVTFTPQSGQWVVTNGTYRNNAVQQTNITLAPIHTGQDIESNGDTSEFTFRASMLNPYAGAGNLIGLVFDYEGSTRYSEVVFSPTGVAKVNRVENGVTTTLATASYGGSRNVAFAVELQIGPGFVSVLANSKRIFANVPAAHPNGFAKGGVGLITHWAPGRFDNVDFDHGIFVGCSQTFSDPSQPPVPASGTWNTEGGTLNSTAVGANDIVAFGCEGNQVGDDAGMNFDYNARLLNEYSASGNLVGLVLKYQDGGLFAGDYYEVVFSPTGVVQVNKFIQGQRRTVTTATHNVPRNTWFDVQLTYVDHFVILKVNGVAVDIPFSTPGTELRGGKIGVVTHWAKGRFDNVSLTGHWSNPPSEL